MVKINGNEIRPGYIIEHKGGLWNAVKVRHVKPGKGGAFAQVELKNITEGTKLNERFRSSQTVERVRLEQKKCQFLYADGDMLNFMDQESFDQVSLGNDLVGESISFLQEGMVVSLESFEGRFVGIELPDQVILEVIETEPYIKGQTAASSNKPALLENQLRVMVPPFISTGDKIVVDTRDTSYIRPAE